MKKTQICCKKFTCTSVHGSEFILRDVRPPIICFKKWQKMTSDLQLWVIRRIHKNVTEVHSENNEKLKYCKECISRENKSIEKQKLKRFVERSSSALSRKVQKFLRERFTLYFHVRFFPYKN